MIMLIKLIKSLSFQVGKCCYITQSHFKVLDWEWCQCLEWLSSGLIGVISLSETSSINLTSGIKAKVTSSILGG